MRVTHYRLRIFKSRDKVAYSAAAAGGVKTRAANS